MNDSIMPSHTLSAVLHGVFLVIAFLSPVAPDLHSPLQTVMWERVAEARVVETMPQPTPTALPVRQERENLGKTSGTAGGDGSGRRAGDGPKMRIEGDEPVEPSLKQAPAAIVEEVQGLLAGFTDQTIGNDAETALGQLDDGGGGGPAFGVRGFGMSGRGSCWGGWQQVRTKTGGYKRVAKKTGCPKAQLAMGLGAIGKLGSPGTGAEPDLGDKLGDCDGQECVNVSLLLGAPTGCDITKCPWKDIIGKVIKRHLREVESCYDDALRRHGGRFRSDVVASFRLPPEGGVAEVSLTDESGVGRLDACITSRASRWIFPETGHEIVANYPFRFDAI